MTQPDSSGIRTAPPGVYRLCRSVRPGVVWKDYRGTYEIEDQGTSQRMASCDLMGNVLFTDTAIDGPDGKTWMLTPNRKVMPTRWFIHDASKSLVVQYERNLARKLADPLYRILITLLDAHERELYRVVDPRRGTADRIFGVGPDEWAILEGEQPVGCVVWLPRAAVQGGGVLQKVRNWLTSSDRGIVSNGAHHVLLAPVALSLLLIVHELTASASA